MGFKSQNNISPFLWVGVALLGLFMLPKIVAAMNFNPGGGGNGGGGEERNDRNELPDNNGNNWASYDWAGFVNNIIDLFKK